MAPGDYSVETWSLPGWEVTSPDPVAVTVGAGETVEVSFGLRWAPTATPAPTDAPPEPTDAPPAAQEAAPTDAPRPTDAVRPSPTPAPAGRSGPSGYAGVLVALAAIGIVALMRVLRSRD